MAGGSATAWRVGKLVFKRAHISEAELDWQVNVLAAARPDRVRLVVPVQSPEGRFIVEGWLATPLAEGGHEPGRWLDVIATGRRLSAAIAHLPRPAYLDQRRSPWDAADRQAWDDEPLDALQRYPHLAALAGLRRPVQAPAQVIHGDLTGNVLFAEGLAPAVIDFSAYWRPAAYAGAIVVADALVWDGAPDAITAALDPGPDAGQFLVRALLFRAVAEIIRKPDLDPGIAARPFGLAIQLAQALLEAPRES
jgi:uncharacterized protein (TIGR02569 family)